MSVILEALKKLDREKLSRRDGSVNIAVEILRPDLPYSGKRTRLYVATIALTVVVTLAITYAVIVEFGFLSKSSPPVSVISSSPGQQVAPSFPETSPASKSSTSRPVPPMVQREPIKSAPLSRETIHHPEDKISQGKGKIEIPVESKIPAEVKPSIEIKTSSTSLDEKKADQIVTSEKTEVAPEIAKKPVEPIPSETSATPPPIKISAIVWHQDPAIRFAMINGIKATEGSVIEGVKVVEINPTSVRFYFNDQYFEISLLR